MQTVLVIVFVLIFLLTLTLFISVNVNYDVFNNIGKIKVFIFKLIPIFISEFSVVGEYLNLSKWKNKPIKIKLDINDKQVQFFKDVSNYLLKKITPISLKVNVLFSLENPVVACLTSGTINVGVSVLFAYILSKNSDIKLYKNIRTGFRQANINFDLSFSALFSLYDYAWAYLKAYKALKGRDNEKVYNQE